MAGGMAMVQEPESADFDQMPTSAIATGLVDFVLPPEKMPRSTDQVCARSFSDRAIRRFQQRCEYSGSLEPRVDPVAHSHSLRLSRLSKKHATAANPSPDAAIANRTTRAAYAELLRENPDEVIALYKDLLISVTSFFRDPEAFQILEQRIIPELVDRHAGEIPLRIWVPSCATGEEAYSIAILLMERFGQVKATPNLQVFASDIDEEALGFARAGIYPDAIAGDLAPERLRRFFHKTDEHSYQVNKRLRETIVFAPQNLIGDAPFSKLDLISCRNLLIYLEPEVQKKLISLFHFATQCGWFLDPRSFGDDRPARRPLRTCLVAVADLPPNPFTAGRNDRSPA